MRVIPQQDVLWNHENQQLQLSLIARISWTLSWSQGRIETHFLVRTPLFWKRQTPSVARPFVPPLKILWSSSRHQSITSVQFVFLPKWMSYKYLPGTTTCHYLGLASCKRSQGSLLLTCTNTVTTSQQAIYAYQRLLLCKSSLNKVNIGMKSCTTARFA